MISFVNEIVRFKEVATSTYFFCKVFMIDMVIIIMGMSSQYLCGVHSNFLSVQDAVFMTKHGFSDGF